MMYNDENITHISEKQETRIEDVFTENEVSNYDLFIEKLKQLKENGHTTKDILDLICEYYKKCVSYNYDQLQIVKIRNQSRHTEIANVMKKYPYDAITPENAEQIKQQYISDLNSVFMQLEGRTLTPRTIERLFSEFGTVIHHPAKDYEMFGKQKHKDAYDEIKGINTGDFPSIYCNGMLQEGVCSEYATVFEKRICEDLGIKHISVKGAGTTLHAWSLIYLPEEQRWAHFDMTMVKYYQDGWIKDHSPYTEKDWIAATTEDIFKMQPTREIHSINGKSCFLNRDNYGDSEAILSEECRDINILDSAVQATKRTRTGVIKVQKQTIQFENGKENNPDENDREDKNA